MSLSQQTSLESCWLLGIPVWDCAAECMPGQSPSLGHQQPSYKGLGCCLSHTSFLFISLRECHSQLGLP